MGDFISANATTPTKNQGRDKRDCEKCHTDGGSYQDDDAGRLAGQWAAYLEESIEDYRSGKRHMLEEKMQQKIDALDAASVAALVQYYASLK